MDLEAALASDEIFFDNAVLAHGFSLSGRDYDIIVDVAAAKPDGSASYIMGRFRYRFTHCPFASVETLLSGEDWRGSWDDHLTDYQEWLAAGEPEGFVWGVNWSPAYPGLSYKKDSKLAEDWSKRVEHRMHEIELETNSFKLRLICSGLAVEQLEAWTPEQVTPPLRPVGEP